MKGLKLHFDKKAFEAFPKEEQILIEKYIDGFVVNNTAIDCNEWISEKERKEILTTPQTYHRSYGTTHSDNSYMLLAYNENGQIKTISKKVLRDDNIEFQIRLFSKICSEIVDDLDFIETYNAIYGGYLNLLKVGKHI